MVKDYVSGSPFDTEPSQPAASRLSQPESSDFPDYQAEPRVATPPKTVRLQGVEINLSVIAEFLMKPLVWAGSAVMWVINKLLGKSRSRRGGNKLSGLDKVKLMRFAAIGGLVMVLFGIVTFFALFAWFSRDLPKPGEVVRREGFSSRIFDRNGELLYDLYSSERRVSVDAKDMPQHLKDAVVAIEDKDFYKHKGFDFLTIARIPYNIIFRQRVVGGSTLTQQLVKNTLLTSERTITRKFKELVLAMQIERRFSKDEILVMYLNEAPYGGTAWGIGAGADMYFGKKVQDLTLAESAFLAALPQRPSVYSPIFGKTDENGVPYWKPRARTVLEKMKEEDMITDIAKEEALAQLDTLVFEQNVTDIKAPHFVFYVRDQLEEMFGEEVVQNGGLQVTTTLDSKLQDEAQTIVREEVEKTVKFHITNGAAMVVNPKNGEIISMVGSADYFAKADEASPSAEVIGGQFNVAVDGLRQPGSSIKPVTYLALLQRGYTPASMLMDVSTTFATGTDATEKPYQPNNYDGKFRGPVNVRESLGNSLNVPAVKALALVGVENFLQQAHDMGFKTLEPTGNNMKRFGLSVTLGGGEVHLIDTVTAYSAFANGGKKVEPISILKVQDMHGKTLFEQKPVEGRQVINPEHAFLINDILSDNGARTQAFGPSSLLNTGKAIAVKTGTTNDRRDNWTVGWSQEIMVGVWVGNNDNSAMTYVASGITGASPIWRRIIDKALTMGYGAPGWEVPSNIEKVQVDALSGYPSHDGFPEKTEYVVKGTLPSLPDPVHTKIKLCRGQEKLATDAQISAGEYDEREYIVAKESDPVSQDGKNRWQESINAWINGQSDSRYKVPTEMCGENSDVSVRMNRPEHEKSYNDQNIEFEVSADSGDGIEKIEIIIDGSVRETIHNREYKGKINLSKGRYEVWAKAYSRGGKTSETSRVRIGTGGEDWKAPTPSPSPSPSPTPSPTPLLPSPSVSPLP